MSFDSLLGRCRQWFIRPLPVLLRHLQIGFPFCIKIIHKLGLMVHGCNPSTKELETGGLGVVHKPQLHSKFKASVGYMRPCLKKREGERKKKAFYKKKVWFFSFHLLSKEKNQALEHTHSKSNIFMATLASEPAIPAVRRRPRQMELCVSQASMVYRERGREEGRERDTKLNPPRGPLPMLHSGFTNRFSWNNTITF